MTGVIALSPANLRAGPATDYATVVQLSFEMNVGIFGTTPTQDWLLVRVLDTFDDRVGSTGWMAADLVRFEGDLADLPRYVLEADGSLTEIGVTPTATPTTTPTPGPTATTTPILPTPEALLPLVVPQVIAPATATPPPPGVGEFVLVMGGQEIPANPFAPIPATSGDRTLSLRLENAQVEIWRGIFDGSGAASGDDVQWIPAQAELLWPGTRIHILGTPDVADPNTIMVNRARIVAAAPGQTPDLLSVPALSGWAYTGDEGSDAQPAVTALLADGNQQRLGLLSGDGSLTDVPINGRSFHLVGNPLQPDILITYADLLGDRHSFVWMRADGAGLRIYAQPYQIIQGVVRDPGRAAGSASSTDPGRPGGLWWIEAPQADLDSWQLWHYNLATDRVEMRLQGSAQVFGLSNATLSPVLTGLLPESQNVGAGGATTTNRLVFLVDTLDRARQKLYTGLYRLTLSPALDLAADLATGAGTGNTPSVSVRPLLAEDGYRGPLLLSPDRRHLAYYVYNPDRPSQTSGFIQPPNELYVLALDGLNAGRSHLLYGAASSFEFLAPNSGWVDDLRLNQVLARFGAGIGLNLDRFAMVLSTVRNDATGLDSSRLSYLFPAGQQLRTLAPCADRRFSLFSFSTDGDEGETATINLGRWDGLSQPQLLSELPPTVERVLLCWAAPEPVVGE